MTSQNWIQVLMPCVYPRQAGKKISGQDVLKSFESEDCTSDIDADRIESIGQVLPQGYGGLEPVTLLNKNRPQTILVSELPTPTPTKPKFTLTPSLPVVIRSKSDDRPGTFRSNKSLKGKRKRSQTLNISGPSEVRQGPSNDPKLFFPLTYPSPSRLRPERFTLDRREPGLDNERPNTAPSKAQSPASCGKDSLYFQPHTDRVLSHTWRLAPLPPMPALHVDNRSREVSDASSTPIKRKPVPLRIRGASDPTSSSPRFNKYDEAASWGIGCAVEMPGSIPPTANKSPIELAVAPMLTPAASVPKSPDTPFAELDAAACEAASHNEVPSLPTSPTSPRSPIYSNRLSEGALDLLNFFPTTPKVGLSRANSIKSVKSFRSIRNTPRPASVEPPLSPRLVEFAETKFRGSNGTIISKAGEIKIQQIEIKPLQPRTRPSPARISPPAILPTQSPVYVSKYENRALPPTPDSASYGRGRFMSIAAGMAIDELRECEFAGLGISTSQDASSRKSSAAESVQIYMAVAPQVPV